MAADAFIQCRVTATTKQALRTVALRQQLTESALLKRLIDLAVQGVSEPTVAASQPETRGVRLSVRLRAGDQRALKDRAAARQLAPATYVSLLVHAHLHGLAPLPEAELKALRSSITELGITRKYAHHLAYVAQRTGQITGPQREEVTAMVNVLDTTHTRVKALLAANLKSWESSHGR